jgi:hypothetical protein
MPVSLIDRRCFRHNKRRYGCLVCDISAQHQKSRYYSAKYVGETAAHRFRNAASNPRNNRLRKIERITRRGVLFDIEPFIIKTTKEQRKQHNFYGEETVIKQALSLKI